MKPLLPFPESWRRAEEERRAAERAETGRRIRRKNNDRDIERFRIRCCALGGVEYEACKIAAKAILNAQMGVDNAD